MKPRSIPYSYSAVLCALSLSTLGAGASPLITSVVETGGDNEATDTVTAKFTGQTFSNGVAAEFVDYLVKTFGEDVPAFVDRTHHWNGATTAGLPPYLVGGEYIMIGNDNRDNAAFTLEVTVTEPVLVYLLIDNRLTDGSAAEPPESGAALPDWTRMTWLAADGFEPVLTGMNRFEDPSLPDEVGVDENGDGTGPGASVENFSSVYSKSFPAGTFTLREFNEGGRNMYGVVVTRVPGSPNSPPEIVDVAPANNTLFHAAGSGFRFTARTVSPNTIATDGVRLLLNGTDVSASLTTGGNGLARTASYGGLAAATLYQATVIATDQAGRSTTNQYVFDTFASTSTVIEAEDYDHGGGKFETVAGPGAYENLAGQRDVDYHNNNRTAATAVYRVGDFVGLAASGDVVRPAYAGGMTDYHLTQVLAGDWYQFTRNFSEGAYAIYLRASAAVSQGVRLDLVSGGTPETVGTFQVNAGGATLYGYAALSDVSGRPVALRLGGTRTLRLTALAANVNLNLNYLLLVPATAADPAYVAAASPAAGRTDVPVDAVVRVNLAAGGSGVDAGTVRLRFDGADVTSAATVTAGAAGLRVVYDPPADLLPQRAYAVRLDYMATGGTAASAEWAFTTATIPTVVPANYSTPSGSGQSGGFLVRMRKAPDFNAAGTALTLANTATRADQQLADQLIDPDTTEPYLNEAAGPSGDGRATAALVNFDQLAGATGFFAGDVAFPYVDLDVSPDPNNLAMEVTAYLELPAGIHRLGVRSDDGFRVTTGPTFADANLVLGAFEGGRGNGLPGGATEFDVKVESAGVYPIRLVWYEGNGGANVEFYSVNRETFDRTLINDAAVAGSIKAFTSRSTQIFVPTVRLTSPAPNASFPNAPADITLVADAAVQGGQIVKVEYFEGTNKLGETTTAPHQYVWTGANAGRYSLTAMATAGNGLSKRSDPVALIVGTPIRINFQATTAEVPEGYLPDYGDVFDDRGNGYKYGWDVDNLANSRDRNDARSADERYDTFNHMQKPQPAGSLWEIEMPNGRYNVFAVAGEAANIDSIYNIQAEGVTVVSGTPTDAVRWYEGQVAVTVSDGRLSLGNGPTAANNKICFVEIYPLPAETARPVLSPPAVSGGNVRITWTNGGTLESAPTAAGPWISTGDTDGTFTEPATGTAKFYRVRR